MQTQTKNHVDFIKMVANSLAKIYIEPLFELCTEKSQAIHIGGLAEILDWSREFHDQYYDKIIDWETFKCSNDNIYNAATLDSLIIEFGRDRIKKFYAQNLNHTTYFLEKYLTIES